LFLLNMGRKRNDNAPKSTIIIVWDDHMIQPNASPVVLLTPYIRRILLTAIGYSPIPPLVAVMANAPATNAAKIALTGRLTVSGMENLTTQNMAIYKNQMARV